MSNPQDASKSRGQANREWARHHPSVRESLSRLARIAGMKRSGAVNCNESQTYQRTGVVMVEPEKRTVEDSYVYDGRGKAQPTTNTLMRRLLGGREAD